MPYIPQVQGDNASDLDFGAVQRGDPEMEQKMNRVIRACVEAPRGNPICSLHDQGAGGNGERRGWDKGLERHQESATLLSSRSHSRSAAHSGQAQVWGVEACCHGIVGGEGAAAIHTGTHRIWRPGTALCSPGVNHIQIATSPWNPVTRQRPEGAE